MRSLFPLIFLVVIRSAPCDPMQAKLDACAGDFCLTNPVGDRQFVERYGHGSVRFDKDEPSAYFRCFYMKSSGMWVEFQFGGHSSDSPEMMSVFVSRSRLCSDSFAPRASFDIRLERVKNLIGMSEREVITRMGRPSRIELLSGNPKNSIFDKRFGDHAFVYETEDSVLYRVFYFSNSKAVGYRLSVEE